MKDNRLKFPPQSIWFYIGKNPENVVYRDKKKTIIDDHEQSFGSYRHVCLDCDGNFMGENVCYALDVCTL